MTADHRLADLYARAAATPRPVRLGLTLTSVEALIECFQAPPRTLGRLLWHPDAETAPSWTFDVLVADGPRTHLVLAYLLVTALADFSNPPAPSRVVADARWKPVPSRPNDFSLKLDCWLGLESLADGITRGAAFLMRPLGEMERNEYLRGTLPSMLDAFGGKFSPEESIPDILLRKISQKSALPISTDEPWLTARSAASNAADGGQLFQAIALILQAYALESDPQC